MNKPTWEELFGGPMPGLPPVPRNDTPYVDQPECPRDCSGRHGVDSAIACVTCRTVAYWDWWHEYRVNRGVNFHTLVSMNGAPALHSHNMPCPVCGGQFRK